MKVVVVNKKDQVLKTVERSKAHQVNGLLHRGFAVFIFNNKGELLLTKRSKKKELWPLFWDNSCCSHPKSGESHVQAGERRLKEELGFSCQLKYLDKFYYRAVYKNVGSEEEICAVLVGKYDEEIKPDPGEIADFRWVRLDELKEEIKKNPELFTPWLKKAVRLFEVEKTE